MVTVVIPRARRAFAEPARVAPPRTDQPTGEHQAGAPLEEAHFEGDGDLASYTVIGLGVYLVAMLGLLLALATRLL